MDINACQAAVYFNICMIKSVHFGCGVVNLDKKQEKELKRIHEELMLMKLDLSQKLYNRQCIQEKCSRIRTSGAICNN